MTISAVRWGYLFFNSTNVIYNDQRRKRRSADGLVDTHDNITQLPQNFTGFFNRSVSSNTSLIGNNQLNLFNGSNNSSFHQPNDTNANALFGGTSLSTTTTIASLVTQTQTIVSVTTNIETLNNLSSSTTIKTPTTNKQVATTTVKTYRPIQSSVLGPIIYIEAPPLVQFVANLTISYGFDQADLVGFDKIITIIMIMIIIVLIIIITVIINNRNIINNKNNNKMIIII